MFKRKIILTLLTSLLMGGSNHLNADDVVNAATTNIPNPPSAIQSKKGEDRFVKVVKNGKKHYQNIAKIVVGGMAAGVAMGVLFNFLLRPRPSEGLVNFMQKRGIQPLNVSPQTINATTPQESVRALRNSLAPVINSITEDQASRVTGFYFVTLQVR